MSLSAQQLEQRQRLIGASEIAAIAGLNRFSDPIKVWSLKRRGPDGELDPMVPPDESDVIDQRDVGHALEPAIVQLYAKTIQQPDAVILPCHTLVHPVHDFIGATPDRLVYASASDASGFDPKPTHGLEIKIVGRYMADDWDDGVPDDVVCQCQQNMAVAGLQRWDVAALVGGTDFRVETIWRDDDVIEALTDIAIAFWNDFVVADVMPDIEDGKSAQKVLMAKWSQDNGQVIDAPADAEPLARGLANVMKAQNFLKKKADRLKAELCKLTGDNRGMKSDWGSFSWPTMRGGVQWKAVAEELAATVSADGGGSFTPEQVLEDVAEKHRADAYRKAQLYPKKAKKK